MAKDRPATVEKRNKSWSDPATGQEEATAVPGVEAEVQELRDELAEEVRGLKKTKHKKVSRVKSYLTLITDGIYDL